MTPQPQQEYIITEEELKTWETGKWKGKRYNQTWLREIKLPEIRSRPASSAPETLYTHGMVQNRINHAVARARKDEREKVFLDLRWAVEISCHCHTCSYYKTTCGGATIGKVLCIVDAAIESLSREVLE